MKEHLLLTTRKIKQNLPLDVYFGGRDERINTYNTRILMTY